MVVFAMAEGLVQVWEASVDDDELQEETMSRGELSSELTMERDVAVIAMDSNKLMMPRRLLRANL